MSQYSQKSIDLVGGSTVVDMLSAFEYATGLGEIWLRSPDKCHPKDLSKYRESGIDIFHVAPEFSGYGASEAALRYFAVWNSFIAYHHKYIRRVSTSDDLSDDHEDLRTRFILGLQNSDHFRFADDVDHFFGLGQRVSQLTYNEQNRIGAGCTERLDPGLSDFGLEIVSRMNAIGMAIDVSHCGEKTTMDAIESSSKPILVTHSNCRALNPDHPRCKSDEAIKALAERGGVFGITSIRIFVRGEEPTTMEHLLDHFEHAAGLVGARHIGIGSDSDLDGNDVMTAERMTVAKDRFKPAYGFRDRLDIDGQDHPKRIYDLVDGLLKRGFSDADITGIVGGNFRRVLQDIWPRQSLDGPAERL